MSETMQPEPQEIHIDDMADPIVTPKQALELAHKIGIKRGFLNQSIV